MPSVVLVEAVTDERSMAAKPTSDDEDKLRESLLLGATPAGADVPLSPFNDDDEDDRPVSPNSIEWRFFRPGTSKSEGRPVNESCRPCWECRFWLGDVGTEDDTSWIESRLFLRTLNGFKSSKT